MVSARPRHSRFGIGYLFAPSWFRALVGTFLILLAALFVLPFVLMTTASLTPEEIISRDGFRLWPRGFTLYAYVYLFTSSTQFIQAFKVSTLLTIIGTLNTLFWTSMGAYVLSKKYLPYRTGLTMFVFITMLFSGGLIPWYLVVNALKMTDTLYALFIPGSIATWNLIIMRNYFMTIPESLDESAKLDGASDFLIFWRIVLPLSKPILATMIVYLAVGYWNEWYAALILLTTRKDLYPLQLLLRHILNTSILTISSRGGRKYVTATHGLTPSESLRMAAVMVATVPVMVVYPFLQKYFVQGILIGSIKG